MKIGNAILVVFFIWLAIELPIKIFTFGDTHNISGFFGVSLSEWVIFSFILPFFLAIIAAICGKEKPQYDKIYEKKAEIKTLPPVKTENKQVATVEPVNDTIEKPVTEHVKTIETEDIDEKIDKLNIPKQDREPW